MGKFFKGKARKKRTPAYSVSVGNGAMWVDFFVDDGDARGCYLTIKDCHGTFEHRVTGYTYGYLLTAVRQDREKEVEAYAYMIWRISHELYEEVEFAADIVNVLNNRDERLLAKGAENAAKANEEENADEGSKD